MIIATQNRRDRLLVTLGRLASLPERPSIVVVDNASTDDSVAAVHATHPDVDVIELSRNRGAPARNLGVARANTPYVAFADDDSWWAAGALARAVRLFEDHPRLGLLAGRILVGEEEREDPTNELMAASPLPREADLPGPSVLGFVACGAVVRREAFLEAGGFSELLFFFGEETLLAIDMTRRGWGAAYVDDVVAHHHPALLRRSTARTGAGTGAPTEVQDEAARIARRRLAVRNRLLTTWLRRSRSVAAGETLRAAREAAGDTGARRGLLAAMRALPRAAVLRDPVGEELERRLALLD